MQVIYQLSGQDDPKMYKALALVKRIVVLGYGRTKFEALQDLKKEIRIYQVAIEDAARALAYESSTLEIAIGSRSAQIFTQPASHPTVSVPTTSKTFSSEKFRVAADIFIKQCQNGEIDDPTRLGQKLYDIYYKEYNKSMIFDLAPPEIIRKYNEFAAQLLTLNGAYGTLLDELIARGPNGHAE